MMFAAQNYKEVISVGTDGLMMKAECGELKIEFHVLDVLPEGKRGTVKVDDGTGLIVLDSEVSLLDIHGEIIINTYIKGDWEGWVPEPRTWVRPIGL